MQEQLYQVLYTSLLAGMPVDTRNMLSQTTLIGTEDIGTHWKITITGPYATHINGGGTGDYAYEVNYNKQRGPKEIRNYMYVERIIRQVSNVFGGVVDVNI